MWLAEQLSVQLSCLMLRRVWLLHGSCAYVVEMRLLPCREYCSCSQHHFQLVISCPRFSRFEHCLPCIPTSIFPDVLYLLESLTARRVVQVLKICKEDTVLTLTSGGCNALNLLLHGAGRVVAVDCNPAQSALLELKMVAIRHASSDTHNVSSSCLCGQPQRNLNKLLGNILSDLQHAQSQRCLGSKTLFAVMR